LYVIATVYPVTGNKVTPKTMCDINAKSECILIKLSASLVFECICERIVEFHEKILFDSKVINL